MPSGNLEPVQSLPLYTQLFFGLGWLAAGGAAVAIALLPMLGKLSWGPARDGRGRKHWLGTAQAGAAGAGSVECKERLTCGEDPVYISKNIKADAKAARPWGMPGVEQEQSGSSSGS